MATAFQPGAFQTNAFQITAGSTVLAGPNVNTTLTRAIPAKTFTKKHYSDLINDIRYEGEIARSVLEGLSEKDKANLNFERAQQELNELEAALSRSVSTVNWGRTEEAKEKLEKARKDRDHHYYMEIVDKIWAEFNAGKKK